MTKRLLPLLAVAGLLAGCTGSSSPAANATHTPAPTTAPPMTEAQARVLAGAAILTDADMLGYESAVQEHDPQDDAGDRTLQTCLGLTPISYLARNPGTSFTKGEVEVDSSADVLPTATFGTQLFAALRDAKSVPCIESLLRKNADKGDTITSLSANPVPITVAGSDDTVGYQLSVSGTSGGTPFDVSGFQLGALVGQLETDLSVMQSPSGGYTLAQAEAALATSVAHARAAKP